MSEVATAGLSAVTPSPGTSLGLTSCTIRVADNHFVDTPNPLTVSNSGDLAQIDLAGAGTNTFTGSDNALAVQLSGGVPDSTVLTVGPAGGLVLVADGVFVVGTVTLAAGTILVKGGRDIANRGGAFSVSSGGLLQLQGTEGNPVVVTALT